MAADAVDEVHWTLGALREDDITPAEAAGILALRLRAYADMAEALAGAA
jgi:hypothetical protein